MKILFLGASITSAFGLPKHLSFPSVIQEKLKHLGSDLECINLSQPGASSADWMAQIGTEFQKGGTRVIVNALGLSDVVMRIDPDQTKKNLRQLYGYVHRLNSDVMILQIHHEFFQSDYMTISESSQDMFKQLFVELAKSEQIQLLPFFLEGVAGDKHLNLADGLHPNEAGMRMVTDNVWNAILPILQFLLP